VVTPCGRGMGRGSRPGGRHATRGPTQVGPWLVATTYKSAWCPSRPGWEGIVDSAGIVCVVVGLVGAFRAPRRELELANTHF